MTTKPEDQRVITRAEADAFATRRARDESATKGYVCEPMLTEFDQGFVIWTRQPPDVLPIPGDGARTVIDRATGSRSSWPAIPAEDIASLYGARRPSPSRTVDAEVSVRRAARRSPAPEAAATLTVNGRAFDAQGAKGDHEIRHHPLVRAYLGALPHGMRVRGAERHAELIALSDVLHEAGDVSIAAARAMMRNGAGFHLRTAPGLGGLLAYGLEPGSRPEAGPWAKPGPQAGAGMAPEAVAWPEPARPCETCLAALVEFAVLPWSDLAYTAEWRHDDERIPEPGRFPYEVAKALAGGGWRTVPPELGETAIDRAEWASGGRLKAFAAARAIVADFPGVRCGRRGAGSRRAVRLLWMDPGPGTYAVDALTEFAEVVGAPVFPIGVEGGDAIVVADERGRIFVLDQGGEWFVGETIDEALVNLLTGDGPADRLHDDGTW